MGNLFSYESINKIVDFTQPFIDIEAQNKFDYELIVNNEHNRVRNDWNKSFKIIAENYNLQFCSKCFDESFYKIPSSYYYTLNVLYFYECKCVNYSKREYYNNVILKYNSKKMYKLITFSKCNTLFCNNYCWFSEDIKPIITINLDKFKINPLVNKKCYECINR